jgi:type I restriction enzyme S subunit
MSKLADLVRELCPDGVEKKTLNEIGTFIRGAGIQKSELSQHGFPAIHYGEIHMKYGISANSVFSHIETPKSGYRQVNQNDLIVVTTSEDIAGVGKPLAWMGTESPYVSGETYIFRHSQNAKYLAYLLEDKEFQVKKLTHITGTKVKRIHESAFTKIAFPIPPIEVQNEIVSMLDKFRELETELETELESRHLQMQHYARSMTEIFSKDELSTLTLSEFAEIGTGSRNTQDAIDGAEYPFYVRSQTPLSIDRYEFDEQAVLTAGDGVGVGKVFHFANGKYSLHQRAYRVRPDYSIVDPKFLFYYMKNNFGLYLESTAVHASVTSLRRPMFEKFEVTFPSLQAQHKIVHFLDLLESYIGDQSGGIHEELDALRKQYEHYRSTLLTFKEMTVA